MVLDYLLQWHLCLDHFSLYLHINTFSVDFELIFFASVFNYVLQLLLSAVKSMFCNVYSNTISIIYKLYNGVSFRPCLDCLMKSCHFFLIQRSAILVMRNCFAWHLILCAYSVVGFIWGTSASHVCFLNCVYTSCPFAC